MGCYIQVPAPMGKAQQLKALYGAVDAPTSNFHAVPEGHVLICVVHNPFFEAAAIAFDAEERDEFSYGEDDRRKEWLYLDRAKAIELCPQVEDRLA